MGIVRRERLIAIELRLIACWFRIFVHRIGADPSQLSGWNYDSAANAPGERRLWKHGYFSAFRPLLNGLNVTYSTKVTGISLPSGGSSVLVATSKGQYRCSRVVLTVPLGVMKANRIAITPALPAPKLSAIKRLGMGTFNKIALRFPPSAYDLLPDATAHFLTFVPKTFSSTNVRRGFYDWINFKSVRPAVKNPVLVCIAAGTFGKSIESLTNAAIVSKIMPQLRASFPGLPNPIAVAVTRWASDPFTLGSYSFMAPGTSSVEYTELGKPINTASGVPWLQLAGEAYGSWPYPSTVHGAWKAGAAAAQKIIATEDLE